MIKFTCARCKGTIQAPETAVGKKVQCPTCGMRNPVPRPKPKKPVPMVVWVAVGLIVFVGLAWAVWPSGDDADKTNGDVEKKEEIPNFERMTKRQKRMEDERLQMEKERAEREHDAKDIAMKRRREQEEFDRKREAEERRQREADEAAQRERDRRQKLEEEANKNRYE